MDHDRQVEYRRTYSVGTLLPRSIRTLRKSSSANPRLEELLEINQDRTRSIHEMRYLIKEKAPIILNIPFSKEDIDRFKDELDDMVFARSFKATEENQWENSYLLAVDGSEDSEKAMRTAIEMMQSGDHLIVCIVLQKVKGFKKQERLILNYHVLLAARQIMSRYRATLNMARFKTSFDYTILIQRTKCPREGLVNLANTSNVKRVIVANHAQSDSPTIKRRKVSSNTSLSTYLKKNCSKCEFYIV